MDDPLLVGVLHGLANRDGELEPLSRRQSLLVAEPGDRDPLDQLHDKVGPAVGRRVGVEHLGDVRVVHQGQRLALRLEAGDHLLRVHAGLDDLQGDLAAYGLVLLGQEDSAHAALAEGFEQQVGTHPAPRSLHRGGGGRVGQRVAFDRGDGRPVEKALRPLVCGEQRLDAKAQPGVARAGGVEEGGTLPRVGDLDRVEENVLGSGVGRRHGGSPIRTPVPCNAPLRHDSSHPPPEFSAGPPRISHRTQARAYAQWR